MEEVVWVVLYALLGLAAFFAPWYVHYAKELLDVLDALSYALLLLNIFACVLSLETAGITEAIDTFLEDSFNGLAYYSIYLICANISRYLRLGRISLRKILAYFMLLYLVLLLRMYW
uniref:Uncharacterized protein n=1 Tax=Thermofilum pendens TaxID=2269 RepID=A0A7C1NXL4_THEPE